MTEQQTRIGSLDEEGSRRTVEQAFELWVNPELERRREAGKLGDGFQLFAAQFVQWPDGRQAVRLNEEIRGMAWARAKRDVQAGENVLWSDLETVEGFDLGEEEIDCGHFTLIWTGAGWFASFNFQSQRGKCLSLIEKAVQFLDSAKEAASAGRWVVAVDNLFSACELISKAKLVSSHMLELSTKTHASIASQINQWRRFGNVDGAFVDLFNRLARIRPRYRYDSDFLDDKPVSSDDLALVDATIDLERRRLSPHKPGDA